MIEAFPSRAGMRAVLLAALGVSRKRSADLHAGQTTSRSSREWLRVFTITDARTTRQAGALCLAGEIFDVAVDIRASSANFSGSGLVTPERRKPPIAVDTTRLCPWFSHLSPQPTFSYKASGLWRQNL